MNKIFNYATFLPKQYWPYLVFALSCLVCSLIDFNISNGDVSHSVFALSRDVFVNHEYWRLITAHFTHSNHYHLLLNLLALSLLYLLHGEYCKTPSFYIITAILCLVISICLYFFSTHIAWYVGFSGVLHGLFAWGAIIDICVKRKSGYLLLVGLVLKLINENFFSDNQDLANLIGVSVAVDAHFYGAIAGILLALILPKPYQKK